jgi:hypothetical protein
MLEFHKRKADLERRTTPVANRRHICVPAARKRMGLFICASGCNTWRDGDGDHNGTNKVQRNDLASSGRH